jgi:hypothetical protein
VARLAGSGYRFLGDTFGPIGKWKVGDLVHLPTYPGSSTAPRRRGWVMRVNGVESDGMARGRRVGRVPRHW